MRKILIYISVVLIITILLPTVIVKTFNFVPKESRAEKEDIEYSNKKINNKEIEEKPSVEIIKSSLSISKINMYNNNTGQVLELDIDEYVKGVVAAEMPAAFHIEALKAQAIAARTYAISRTIKYKDGHPDHKLAPICNSVHCQAHLPFSQLEQIHGKDWIEDFWPKIIRAVEETKDLGIFYGGEIIEPLYHSTSGGRTEDVKDVYASVEVPYLKSVASPYESDAPKYSNKITMTVDEFTKKIKNKYQDVNLNKDNIHEKIKLINKTTTGRVKKIAIDQHVIDGRDLRDLSELNSTNFTIYLDKGLNIIEIETSGYGHGVGMSQWGANGMAKEGSNFEEILKHYYTGVELRKFN